MRMLARAAALTVVVGGMGLVGTAAHAGDSGYDDPAGNAQFVHCHQTFDAGTAFAPAVGVELGTAGNHENIGDFCTVVGKHR
ncbi:hypothetical protein [Streptomyces anandii]|uniref:hypothetical protein n=1 Tax=Streptomyces anandii TaxID=285454 RepID=UPI0036CB698E